MHSLLYSYMDELLFQLATDGFFTKSVEFPALDASSSPIIRAASRGERFDLSKHPQVRRSCVGLQKSLVDWCGGLSPIGHRGEGDRVLQHAGTPIANDSCAWYRVTTAHSAGRIVESLADPGAQARTIQPSKR